MTKERGETQVPVTWPQMIRDIVIRGMDKGQLLPLFLFTIFIILIIKLDSTQAEHILFSFLDGLKDNTLLGWLLFLLAIIIWIYQIKSMRKKFSQHTKHIGKEKTKLQQKHTQHKLGTSNNRGKK